MSEIDSGGMAVEVKSLDNSQLQTFMWYTASCKSLIKNTMAKEKFALTENCHYPPSQITSCKNVLKWIQRLYIWISLAKYKIAVKNFLAIWIKSSWKIIQSKVYFHHPDKELIF